MTDPFKKNPFGDKTSEGIVADAKDSRGRGKKKEEKKKTPARLYEAGVALFKARNITLELSEEGKHVKHKIYLPDAPPKVLGINYPDAFQPLREVLEIEDIYLLESVLEMAPTDVKDFWSPLIFPKSGDSELLSFAERKLSMNRIKGTRELWGHLEYQQTFDPSGSLTGNSPALHPKIWVPAKEWFDPVLKKVKFEDVFTIFPEAERELLKLFLGRVGVGRTGHLPPGFSKPVSHTSRMGCVVVGNDPGLGKSTLFNNMNSAFSRTGFTSHTFRDSDERFGMSKVALSDIAYKDDTAMASLKRILSSEKTKILVTNGTIETEAKFQDATEVNPRCVLLINSNDWKPEFCYDLDPGIIDRIKLISTYREVELMKRLGLTVTDLSEDSPDLRPYKHLDWLSEKLGVSKEALFLWCLRLCTDDFWSVITDDSNPSVNSLQEKVRHWTSRLRIKFKADMSKSFMSACILSTLIRQGDSFVPKEMDYDSFVQGISDFWFLGTDPSGRTLMDNLKSHWESVGRVTTHPYQAFREMQWKTVTQAMVIISNQEGKLTISDGDKAKNVLKVLYLRDNFNLNTGYSYAGADWNNALFALSDLHKLAREAIASCDEWDLERIQNPDKYLSPDHSWMDSQKYTPKNAEKLRDERKKQIRERS